MYHLTVYWEIRDAFASRLVLKLGWAVNPKTLSTAAAQWSKQEIASRNQNKLDF